MRRVFEKTRQLITKHLNFRLVGYLREQSHTVILGVWTKTKLYDWSIMHLKQLWLCLFCIECTNLRKEWGRIIKIYFYKTDLRQQEKGQPLEVFKYFLSYFLWQSETSFDTIPTKSFSPIFILYEKKKITQTPVFSHFGAIKLLLFYFNLNIMEKRSLKCTMYVQNNG